MDFVKFITKSDRTKQPQEQLLALRELMMVADWRFHGQAKTGSQSRSRGLYC